MSEIPEDVMQAAREAAQKVLAGLPLGKTPEEVERSVACSSEIIARAILAERERRAKAALDYTPCEDDYPSAVARDFYQSGVVDAVSDIAAAIRSPEPPKETE